MKARTHSSRFHKGHVHRLRPRRFGRLEMRTLFEGAEVANVRMLHATLAPNYVHDTLYHANTHEWIYVLEGTTRVKIDNRWRRLTPGHYCYIAPGVHHQMGAGSTRVKALVLFSPPMDLERPDIVLVNKEAK